MRGKQPRWEREAERVRKDGPTWFDADRLPWFVFLLLGVGFAARALYVLVTGDGWDLFSAAGLLLLVVPTQFRAAYRRWRGLPLMPSDR